MKNKCLTLTKNAKMTFGKTVEDLNTEDWVRRVNSAYKQGALDALESVRLERCSYEKCRDQCGVDDHDSYNQAVDELNSEIAEIKKEMG